MMKKINLTMGFSINTPNLNSTIYTHDAIQKAFQESQGRQLPIIDYTDDKEKIIGIATPVSCCLVDDHYSISNDCVLFDDKTIKKLDIEFMINDFHKNKNNITIIDDFRIMNIIVLEEKESV